MPKNVSIGVVTSDKTAKTRRVEIPRLVRHPKYGKILRRKTVCHVHDETERVARRRHGRNPRVAARARKTKRWELVRVVTKSRLVDIAAMRAAVKGDVEVRQATVKQANDTQRRNTISTNQRQAPIPRRLRP